MASIRLRRYAAARYGPRPRSEPPDRDTSRQARPIQLARSVAARHFAGRERCCINRARRLLRVLAARGIGLPVQRGHFLLGALCVLGYYRDIPAVKIWNGRLSLTPNSLQRSGTRLDSRNGPI